MFHFDSVFKIQNRTRQCFCMNYIYNDKLTAHAGSPYQAPISISAKFFKFLQDPTCAIFYKCRGF